MTRFRLTHAGRVATCGAFALIGVPALAAGAAGAAGASSALPSIAPKLVAAGNAAANPPQSKPDDIATLGGNLYVTYQDGVGPDGTPAGPVTQSTVVGYAPGGRVVGTWLLTGRCDGLGADRHTGELLATVNEDNNSYMAEITPGSPGVREYSYSPNPAEKSPSETSTNGGTDSISVGPTGTIYVAHSNPDPGVPSTAAVYTVRLQGTTAALTPLFSVDAAAVNAVTGAPTTLALTDPDSNRYIPAHAPVLGGSLLQVGQADGTVVIVHKPGTSGQSLQELPLQNAEPNFPKQPTIDDVVEVTGPGTLYVVDQGAGTIQSIDTKHFTPGTIVVAQPSDGTTTPTTPGSLGVLDPSTGLISHFTGNFTFTSPKGLVFVPARHAGDGDQRGDHGGDDHGGDTGD